MYPSLELICTVGLNIGSTQHQYSDQLIAIDIVGLTILNQTHQKL